MGLKGNIRPEIEVKGNVSLPDIIEGKSAYGVAVKNGFKGTEEEWLNSLKNGAGPFAQICLDKSNEALEKSIEALEKSEEANNKYVACVEATENANKVREEIEAGGYIESLKEINKGGKFAIWVGTTEEYKALTEIKTNCLYIKTDDTSMQDIKNQIESLEIVEGADGIWAYEKKVSGIAECWAVLTIKINTLIRLDEYHYCQQISEGYEFPKIEGKPLFASIPAFHYDIGNFQTKGFGKGSVYPLREGHSATGTGTLYIAGISKYIDGFEELYIREDGLRVYKIPEDMEITVSLTAKGSWKEE